MPPSPSSSSTGPLYGLVLPVCDEAECIGPVLDELLEALRDPVHADAGRRFRIAVGINGTTDASAALARERDGVLVGETGVRGYGHGCVAAIGALAEAGEAPAAYVFLAGDGASDPADLAPLLDAFEAGNDLVLGSRTSLRANWRRPWRRHLSNLVLGAWASVWSGRRYGDLGPYRVIRRELYEAMDLREWTWGWTIEAQILAARLGARIAAIPVRERPRIAGEQKVSSVSVRQTLRIGAAILAAGWRAGRRALPGDVDDPSPPAFSRPRS